MSTDEQTKIRTSPIKNDKAKLQQESMKKHGKKIVPATRSESFVYISVPHSWAPLT